MKTVAILQSNYIPWKGNFDMIHMVDEFILYDDMQYTRRDWRNRNRIKTPAGPQWLTIPVDVKGKFTQKIKALENDPEGFFKLGGFMTDSVSSADELLEEALTDKYGI